jgi:acetyl-CoA carboxylase/biotin carboxylase 1
LAEARNRNLRLLEAWTGIPNFATSDYDVTKWYEANNKVVNEKIDALKSEAIAAEMRELVRAGSGSNDATESAGWKGVRDMLRVMPVEERDKMLEFLKQV